MERELLRVKNISVLKRLLAYQVLHVPFRGGVCVFFFLDSFLRLFAFFAFLLACQELVGSPLSRVLLMGPSMW